MTPIAGASPSSFVSQWRASLQIRNRRYYSGAGFGYGADMNGLAEESQPTANAPINYPFKSFDGRVMFTREQWGQRVFDINTDGVANYGMFADWLQALQTLAGRPIVADMFHGSEAYLEMWERAYGVPATSCRPGGATLRPAGIGPLRLGASFQPVLYAAGQPSVRSGQAYQYCVAGPGNRGAGVAAVFGTDGNVAMLLSTSRGYRAGGLAPGAGASRIARRARSLGGGLWLGLRLAGAARFLYGVRRGRVVYVAVVRGREAGSAAMLRGELHAAGVA